MDASDYKINIHLHGASIRIFLAGLSGFYCLSAGRGNLGQLVHRRAFDWLDEDA